MLHSAIKINSILAFVRVIAASKASVSENPRLAPRAPLPCTKRLTNQFDSFRRCLPTQRARHGTIAGSV
jgi:hypothetical protein